MQVKGTMRYHVTSTMVAVITIITTIIVNHHEIVTEVGMNKEIL